MRKNLLFPLGVLLAVVAMTSVSFAGDYHSGSSLICSDCHVMHYSQSHGYNANGSGIFTPLGAGGPFHYLLRDDINDLCLACHDNQTWAPDVFEGHGNGYVRSGGALNELGGNGLYPEATGHTLNSTAVAPGGTWSNPDGLNCTNCHSPHGANPAGVSAYRNLGGYSTATPYNPNPAWWITYSRLDVDGANDLSKWVFEDASSGTSASHYGVNHITFNEPVATASTYANFCKTCHTDFHGDVGVAEIGGVGSPATEYVRHPAASADIGAVGGGHSRLTVLTALGNQVPVMSPTGQRNGAYDGTDTGLTPSCMSCHKGHGNQNAFGLIFMNGTGTVTEQGDNGTQSKDLCKQCHGQG
jgi:hypothetical protein